MSPGHPLLDRVGTSVATILRGHPPADEQTVATFDTEGRFRCRRGTRTLCLLAIALITASAILGVLTPGEFSSLFLQVRLGALLALGFVLWLLRTSYGHGHPQKLALLALVVITVTIETLALYTGGQASTQQYRLNFVIIAAAVFVTCSPAWSAVAALMVVGLHVAVTMATEPSMVSPEVLQNLGFLVASSVTALVIAVTRERVRWRDFRRRQSLASVQCEVIEREQQYRSLVETAGSAILLLAPDHRVLECNPELERVLGRRRQDILGQDAFELFIPEGARDRAAAEAERALAGESIRGLESPILTADGKTRIFLSNVSCFRDGEGLATGIIVVGQDITERRQAEREVRRLNAELEQRVLIRTGELQESEEKFRAVFESSTMGMMIADGTLPRMVRTNQAFQELIGYTDSELQTMDIVKLTYPEDLQKSMDAFAELEEGKTPSYRLEKRYVRQDGSLLLSDTRVFAARDGEGALRHVYVVIQDITERKQKQALQRGEMRALELLARRASLTEALTALIGELEELVPGMICSVMLTDEPGKRLWHVAAPGLPEEYRQATDGLDIAPTGCAYGSSAYRRTSVITEDIAADPLWADFRELAVRHGIRTCWSYPVLSPSGRLLGTLSIHHGRLCRPSAAEATLMDGAVQVAAIIIERKRDADLISHHQVEMAHASRVSLVGELAASLAHDLHQPLAAITNYASGCVRRIEGGTGEPEQLMYPMEQIRLLALRAGETIRHLRDLIRKGDMLQGRVDINQLVRNAVSLAEPEARQHGITMRLDLDGEIPPVEIDSVQIEQVVLNLLSNAIEAMTDSPTNGKELSVKSSVEKDSLVRVAVTDSGKSVSASTIDRVFEPFYTTKPHGLGMGLAISRSIVESHGGRMWAALNPGGGMTFQFTLPGSG